MVAFKPEKPICLVCWFRCGGGGVSGGFGVAGGFGPSCFSCISLIFLKISSIFSATSSAALSVLPDFSKPCLNLFLLSKSATLSSLSVLAKEEGVAIFEDYFKIDNHFFRNRQICNWLTYLS
ncbi:MAG: hypothetical protein K1000chlam1_01603 [Candidatus Anoxychlamydiales bacterium]|nr:hypothetical protein [Candidatus Anoxychlamydiales bacterium]